jgi:hypothetical protein
VRGTGTGTGTTRRGGERRSAAREADPKIFPVPRDVHPSFTPRTLEAVPGCGHAVSAAVELADGRVVRGCARHCAEALLAHPGAVVLDLGEVPPGDDTCEAVDHGSPPPPEPPDVGPLSVAARRLARRLAGELDSRWAHTCAVAARAATAVGAVGADRADLLVAAAWLHDIGYAPALRRHDFHPVDGAQHLAAAGWPPVVCGLVAHHSGARFVARVRDLEHCLAPFADPVHWRGPLADAVTWADQTTSPAGRVVTVDERLAEVIGRHGPDSPNARCHDERGPALRAAVAATERRLAAAGAHAGVGSGSSPPIGAVARSSRATEGRPPAGPRERTG